MKHIVSFETAKALKAAGYPQPEFETGQIWYHSNGLIIIVGRVEGIFIDSRYVFCVDTGESTLDNPAKLVSFYAASATEIIQAISITENSADLYCCSSWQASDCFQTLSEFHENPAEAAAEIYLKIKQQ